MRKLISTKTLVLAFVLVANPLWAVTRTVTTAVDDIDPTNSALSLREAVGASKSGDTVRFVASLSGEDIELEHGAIAVTTTIFLDAGNLVSPPTITPAKGNASQLFDVTGSLRADALIFTGGRSKTVDGGAIGCVGGTLRLENCKFSDNEASSADGGAVFCSGADVTLVNCVFSGNRARRGGGLSCVGSDCQMTNCTVSGNRATVDNGGGGLHFNGGGGALRNSILWNNRVASGSSPLNQSYAQVLSTTVFSNMLIEGRDALGSGSLDGNDPNNDPRFEMPVDPLDAPTTKGELRPQLFSMTLNVGDDSQITAADDVAGEARTVGIVDLGAYEFQRGIVYVDAEGSAVGDDGRSWATAYNFLGEGLDVAGDGDAVFIAEGVYFPDEGAGRLNGSSGERFVVPDGGGLHGGFPAGGGVRNVAAYVTVLSGDIGQDDEDTDGNGITESHTQMVGSNTTKILAVESKTGVVIEGLTICGGVGGLPISPTGGCVYVLSSEVEFRDCAFLGGFSRQRDIKEPFDYFGVGAGVRVASSTVEFERCRFSGNFAMTSGAALRIESSSVALGGCYFSANEGDAIDSRRRSLGSNSSLQLSNCVFAGNVGGVNFSDTNAVVTNCTFSGDRSSAISLGSGASCELINSIVWMNGDAGQPSISDRDGGMSYSVSLVEGLDLSSGGGLDGTDLMSIPAFVRPTDPSAAPSMDGILLLTRGSLAIDRGDSALNPSDVDVRGQPRVAGISIDLGAYEGSINEAFDEDLDCLPDYWELQHSLTGSATSMDADADRDGDGLSNLAELYHGLDPNRPNKQDDYMDFTITAGAEPRLVIRWREWAPAARGFVFAVAERSNDLRFWSTEGMESGLGDGILGRRHRILSEPISPTNKRHYLRLKIYRCTDV